MKTTGSFLEIPITTVKIPALINIFFKIFRKIKYPDLESEREEVEQVNIPNQKECLILINYSNHYHIQELISLRQIVIIKERFSYMFKRFLIILQ